MSPSDTVEATEPTVDARRWSVATVGRRLLEGWQQTGSGARRRFGLAVAAAFASIVAGPSPTGRWITDVVVVTIAAWFVIWSGRRAPWPLLAGVGVVPLVLMPFPESGAGGGRLLGVGLGLVAVGLAVSTATYRDLEWQREGSIAVALVGLSLLGDVGPLGTTTLVGVAASTVVAMVGLQLSPAHDVQFARRFVAVAFGSAALATVVGGGFAWWARADLIAARRSIDSGVAAASTADIDTAAASLHDARRQFGYAHLKLANPLVWPARLVPGVAQNLHAASVGAASAKDFTGAVTDTIDLAVGTDGSNGVRIRDGAVDLDSLNRLVAAAAVLPSKVDQLASAAPRVESAWLVPPLANGLRTLATTAEEQRPVLEEYADAAQLLPGFFGADGPRHYFVMFTTPAEARGQGGFMGNFAEITVDRGKISMSRFGRVNDLEAAMDDNLVLSDVPTDWLERYGPYGFVTEPNGTVAEDVWAIINLSAHFPSTAEVVAELYPRSGGNELDGVFSLDVYGLEALVGLVGPIEVNGGPELDGDNTADFLLLGQYLLNPDDGGDRVDMLSTIANEVVDRLLRDDPPNPGSLASAWAPLARERRLLAWSTQPNEAAWFEDLGLSGAVLDAHYRATDPAPPGRNSDPPDTNRDTDGDADLTRPAFQVVLNNGTGSKIDSFLRRQITVDGHNVTVVLHNTAPSDGIPRYVIGTANNLDLPLGTSVSNFTVYSSSPLTNFTLDGQAVDPPAGSEAGYPTYDMRFAIGPGERRTITFTTVDADNVNLLQPLARSVDDTP